MSENKREETEKEVGKGVINSDTGSPVHPTQLRRCLLHAISQHFLDSASVVGFGKLLCKNDAC